MKHESVAQFRISEEAFSMKIRKLKRQQKKKQLLSPSSEKQILRRKLSMITAAHFPDIEMNDDTTCLDCRDYKAQTCLGKNLEGHSIIDCMMKKLNSGEFLSSDI
jgi:hypothetical protein